MRSFRPMNAVPTGFGVVDDSRVLPVEHADEVYVGTTHQVHWRVHVERCWMGRGACVRGGIDVEVNEVVLLAERLHVHFERRIAGTDERHQVATCLGAY